MNLTELQTIVNAAVENCIISNFNPDNITVGIHTAVLGQIAGIHLTDIQTANLGFDWDRNKFIVSPKKSLREIDRDEILELKKKYDEIVWSTYKINQMKRENDQLKRQLVQYEKHPNPNRSE